jgi:SAM-dependent methyltransferase
VSSSKFDAYRDTYNEEVQQSIAFAGQDHEFFVRQKAKRLLEVVERRLGPPQDLRFLDVGCGVGLTDRFLAPAVGTLDGADVSEEAIERAAADNPDVAYRAYEGSALPYDEETFDVVFAMCVLHHVPPQDWSAFVDDLARVTCPGGLLVVFEHNPLNPLTRLAVSRCAFDDDAVLVTRRDLARLLESRSLKIVDSRYILFFPRSSPRTEALEHRLAWLPLGAQHLVAGRR